MCQFRNPDEGRHVHHQFVHSGFKSNVFVVSSLIDMYAKCGSTEDAWKVFNETPIRNMVCWSAMIVGYVRCGQGQKALELSQQMHQDGVEPDSVTFVGILNACASVAALEEGRCVHKQIVYVVSSLIDMYAKCGSIEDARRVFNKMTTHTTISWNAMLAGYAIHGHAKEALGHFEQMCQGGVGLDMVTFVSLLSACSLDCDETLMQLVMRLFLESGEKIFKSGLQWPTVLKHLCISKKKELFTRKFENGRRG